MSGKKFGLDTAYNKLKAVTKTYPITGGTPTSTFMKRSLNLKAGQPLTTSVNKGSKLLNIGKKVFSKTPIGRAVNLAVNVGSGIGIGYSYAKNKFNKKKADFQKGDYSDIKMDKKSAGGEMNQMNIKGYMSGGASRGYGAARTSGMGLQDESLMPGKMVTAKNSLFLEITPEDPREKRRRKLKKKQNPNSEYNQKGLTYTAAKNGRYMKK